MPLNRRDLLHLLAAGAGASILPRSAWADFPAQNVIDDDPLRPRYHLMPRRGWMNDPCAPVFYKGLYHMFFQYNPGASVWGDMHWAHAVSRDMVHWQHRPVALAPTPRGADSAGVFTGSMVLQDGKPVAIYTGVRKVPHAQATIHDAANDLQESQCLATPTDDSLDTWQKLPQPVIAAPPEGMQVQGFRDPAPWREKDGWYMVVASGRKGIGGNVLLYKSADLRRWQFVKIFAEGKPVPGKTDLDAVNTGEMWECPDFFPLRDSDGTERHVLIHSSGTPEGRVPVWQSGVLDRATMTFTPEKQGVLNHGPYYAPKTQVDADGNRILWGWIPETRPEAEFAKAGWAGCMSLPRVLTLEKGELRFASLRTYELFSGEAQAVWDQQLVLLDVARTSSFRALAGPRPYTLTNPLFDLYYDPSLKPTQCRWRGQVISFDSPVSLPFKLHMFIDKSVTEVFIGNSAVLTARTYELNSALRAYEENRPDIPAKTTRPLSLGFGVAGNPAGLSMPVLPGGILDWS